MAEFDPRAIDRIRALEARVAQLERMLDMNPQRLAVPGVFGTIAFVKNNDMGLGPNSEVSVSLLHEDESGDLVDTGSDMTCHSPPYLKAKTIAAGKYGIALRLFKRLWWIGGECPT